jgi:hypothetical protein
MSRSRPGFLEGVVVAVVASLAGGALYRLLAALLGAPDALTSTAAAVGLGYLLYLLQRSDEPAGRISTVLVWLATTAACSVLSPGLVLPVQLALVWVVRALYHQPGLIAAAADLGLVLLGLGAALWALTGTGSLAAALWCFFLVQALFSAIPSPRPSRAVPGPDDRFGNAERSAARILRRRHAGR